MGMDAFFAALDEERAEIERLGADPACQADYIRKCLDERVQTYIKAKENGGETFPDFVGALVMDDLPRCVELSAAHQAMWRKERQAAVVREAEEEKAFCEEQNRIAEQAILGLQVRCRVIISDNSHWCIQFIGYRLPQSMLCQLLQAAQATPEECEDAISDEGTIDSELGMDLAERLIARHLKLAWEHRLITEDSLLLVGVTKGCCQFTDEQLAEIYRCVHETLDSGYPITAEREALLKDVCAWVRQKVPDLDAIVMRSNEKELEAAQRRPEQ